MASSLTKLRCTLSLLVSTSYCIYGFPLIFFAGSWLVTLHVQLHVIAQLVERWTVAALQTSIGHWFDSCSRDPFYPVHHDGSMDDWSMSLSFTKPCCTFYYSDGVRPPAKSIQHSNLSEYGQLTYSGRLESRIDGSPSAKVEFKPKGKGAFRRIGPNAPRAGHTFIKCWICWRGWWMNTISRSWMRRHFVWWIGMLNLWLSSSSKSSVAVNYGKKRAAKHLPHYKFCY